MLPERAPSEGPCLTGAVGQSFTASLQEWWGGVCRADDRNVLARCAQSGTVWLRTVGSSGIAIRQSSKIFSQSDDPTPDSLSCRLGEVFIPPVEWVKDSLPAVFFELP